MVRTLQGLNLIGADVVEVSPPFDVGGITAYAGATMLFELACVLAPAVAARKNRATVLNERLQAVANSVQTR